MSNLMMQFHSQNHTRKNIKTYEGEYIEIKNGFDDNIIRKMEVLGKSKQLGIPNSNQAVAIYNSGNCLLQNTDREENIKNSIELPILRGIEDGLGGWTARDKYISDDKVKNVSVERNIHKIELTGYETWDRFELNSHNVQIYFNCVPRPKKVEIYQISCMSNIAKGIPYAFRGDDGIDNCCWCGGSTGGICFIYNMSNELSNLNKFKEMLIQRFQSGTPVVMEYVLENAVIESGVYEELYTSRGLTKIETNGEIKADLKGVVEVMGRG